ncbi:MAG: sporulation protein YabP [Candidatus Fimenecus sp.]|nr:sporulation protein YabP [Ruminococcus sp.]MDO4154878.1 sporulation protein YabP [Clostridia bacterium]
MAMNEQNSINQMPVPHNVILEDRRRLTVSGVCDVDSFDEQTVIVFTQMGELTVKGEDLHINRLSLEMGELALEGDITALTYTDRAQKPQQGSFWGRVFR